MQNFMIRFCIKDADGQHQYDYSDEFIVSLDYTIGKKQGNNKIQNDLFKLFKEKIKSAVIEWFNKDAQCVRDEIEEYGYMNTFEPDPDGSDEENNAAELNWVVDNFPARCVSHIPTDIMKNNGFFNAPDPICEHEFYNDHGFLNEGCGDEIDIVQSKPKKAKKSTAKTKAKTTKKRVK